MHEKTLLIQLNFGTTDSGEIYYRVGTHRNIDSLGTSWQRIPGVLTHITSGINRVYGVDSSKKLWKMNSDVSFNEQGEMTWQESPWELITERSGSYVSALWNWFAKLYFILIYKINGLLSSNFWVEIMIGTIYGVNHIRERKSVFIQVIISIIISFLEFSRLHRETRMMR